MWHLPTPGLRTVLALGLIALAAAVWFPSGWQRETAEKSFADRLAAQEVLTSMLDQEAGFRGFILTADETFLEPYSSGRLRFDAALAVLRGRVLDDDTISALDASVRSARRWQGSAEKAIQAVRAGGPGNVSLPTILERKRIIDRYRAEDDEMARALDADRAQALQRARELTLALTIAGVLLLGALGIALIRRRATRDQRVRDRQREYASALHVARNETEVHALVRRQLERSLPGTTAILLNRNASDDRLDARTSAAALPRLEEMLRGAAPSDCVGMRLGRNHAQARGEEPLLPCTLCEATGKHAFCVPTLVAGKVIGSVVTASDRVLTSEARLWVEEAVDQAAPVMANLNAITIAEQRAETDVLTGLANRRAAADTLRRMSAQAARTAAPLTAVMMDVDHFKRHNDVHGHDAGDAALAEIGALLTARLRDSDLVARWGGEEFLILLPDTSVADGAEIAETLRARIAGLSMPEVPDGVTASFGVAEFPLDGADAETFVRAADRALYEAKRSGRNRVCIAARPDPAHELLGGD